MFCFHIHNIDISARAGWHGHRSGHSRPKTTSKKCTKLQDAGYSVGHTIGTGGCVASTHISSLVSAFRIFKLTLPLPLPAVGHTIGTGGCLTFAQCPLQSHPFIPRNSHYPFLFRLLVTSPVLFITCLTREHAHVPRLTSCSFAIVTLRTYVSITQPNIRRISRLSELFSSQALLTHIHVITHLVETVNQISGTPRSST